MTDLFEYKVAVPAEDITQYCSGGYHPVHLGDSFNGGQYQVKHKLGYGSFSTVWLARDLRANRNVTLKIIVAQQSRKVDQELQILTYLSQKSDDSHPGHKHVIHLLDSFYHEGPNGQHLCLIFDVLGPSVSSVANRCPNFRLEGSLARAVSAQVLLAVHYIHSIGIVHGDIYLGNILFRVPDLDSLSPEELGQPNIGKVVRKDGQPLGKCVPDYLVAPIKFRVPTDTLCEVQLIDFGESFFSGRPPKSIITPTSFRPPEVVFQLGLTNAMDIWSLGCTTYALITGRTLFEADFSDHELIPQFKTVIGNIPEDWISKRDELPNDALANGFLPLEEQLNRFYFSKYVKKGTPLLSTEDIMLLARCLRKMLVLDPSNRAQAHELFQEPWFAKCVSRIHSVTDLRLAQNVIEKVRAQPLHW